MADIQHLRAVRLKKAKSLQAEGVDLYPERTPPHTAIAALKERFSSLIRGKKSAGIAGRITAIRGHGGAIFLDCMDGSGKLQILFSRDVLGEAVFSRAALLDIGDFVAIRGKPFRTRRGEDTLEAKRCVVLAKALQPVPAHWYGLHDVEERFRKRELDLLLNTEVRTRFRMRAKILKSIRSGLEDADFLEVETPMLQAIPGGAHAEPFKTLLKALKMPLYLRIAPELYLKRLLVGGFDRVFEMGRAFRNEGMDQTHNPEFTILEFYWAYQDLAGLMAFSEKLLQRTVREATGSLRISFRDTPLSFAGAFPRYEFSVLFRKTLGIDPVTASDDALIKIARAHAVPAGKGIPRAAIVDHLFKKTVTAKLLQPCFLVHHPLDLTPLAKAAREDARLAQRFQILAGGMEIANAYAELNDPLEQRKRFSEEEKKRRSGHHEAQRTDEDFLTALEYGMPPAAGFGLGVDRFVMLLTDAPSLREVLLFPTMRSKQRHST